MLKHAQLGTFAQRYLSVEKVREFKPTLSEIVPVIMSETQGSEIYNFVSMDGKDNIEFYIIKLFAFKSTVSIITKYFKVGNF